MAMPISGKSPLEEPSTHTYLFSHGIADSSRQAYRGYTKKSESNPEKENDRYIIDNEKHVLVTFDYPDAISSPRKIVYPEIKEWSDLLNVMKHMQTFSYRVNRYNSSLAGSNELEILAKQHAAIENPSVIGIGVSRGASALLTWLGMHPDQAKVQNVKALVLESPFDSMDSILRNIIGESLYQYSAARNISHMLLRFVFAQYDRTFVEPITAAAKVPTDLPILIVCSEQDTLVPAWSSENLYKKLQETGHTNVHFIKLPRGVHGKLLQGPDGETYRNAVHAFYMQYGFDHNPEYAQLGQDLFEASQSF